MRVVQFFQDIGLGNRVLLDAPTVLPSFLPDFFDCPFLARRLIDRKVHAAHAAFPHLVEDLVFVIDDLANLQHFCPSCTARRC